MEATPRERTCAFCEHFDGGGQRNVERARQDPNHVVLGDCLNSRGYRFTTESNGTCKAFTPAAETEAER